MPKEFLKRVRQPSPDGRYFAIDRGLYLLNHRNPYSIWWSTAITENAIEAVISAMAAR